MRTGVFLSFLTAFYMMQGIAVCSAQNLTGLWGNNYGEILIVDKNGKLEGKLIKSTGLCSFADGELIFEGDFFEDTVIGTLKMCQSGDNCGPAVWADTVLISGEKGRLMSGTASSRKNKCPLKGFSGKSGIVLKKLKDIDRKEIENRKPETIRLPGPPAEPGSYDPRAAMVKASDEQSLLLKAKEQLEISNFEEARKLFEEALAKDPDNATALYGIGVSFYGRQEFDKAMEFYKKALEKDPNLGIVYYNMACLYALKSKKNLALEYLKISVMNGFAPQDTMSKDPDLKSLQGDPAFEEILKGDF